MSLSEEDLVLEDELDVDTDVVSGNGELFDDNEVFDLDSVGLDGADDSLHDENLDDIDISGLDGDVVEESSPAPIRSFSSSGVAPTVTHSPSASPLPNSHVSAAAAQPALQAADSQEAAAIDLLGGGSALGEHDIDADFSVDDDIDDEDEKDEEKEEDDEKSNSNESSSVAAASSSSASAAATTTPKFTPVRFGDAEGEVALHAPASAFVEIKVMSPTDSGEGFVRYSVQWETTLDQYPRNKMTVQRRYSDFAWLHERLTSNNKSVLIPPIPGKAFNPLNNSDEDFLEARRTELERFLLRCSEHPALYTSADLQLFLEASESALQRARSEKPSQSWGVKIASWLSSSASAVAASAAPEQFGAATELDPWFGTQSAYVSQMQKALQRVEQSASKLISRHAALGDSDAQLHRTCADAADVEINVSAPTANAFKRLSEISAQSAGLQLHLAEQLRLRWERQLRDHTRQFAEAQRLLEHRDSTLGRFQHHSRQVASKKERLEQTQEDKQRKALAEEIEQAEKSEAEAKDLYENTTASCRTELERFNTIRTQEFRETITAVAQMQIEHNLQIVDFYKSLLNEVRD